MLFVPLFALFSLLAQAAMKAASAVYQSKVVPGTVVGRQVGNMYAASLYAALASTVGHTESTLQVSKMLVRGHRAWGALQAGRGGPPETRCAVDTPLQRDELACCTRVSWACNSQGTQAE